VPEIIKIEKEKLVAVLESLQRKVPRLSRHSFSMAFDAAIAIEAKRALSARARLQEEWEKGVIRDHLIFERNMKKVETETDQRISYLRSLQKEALEYYDGETEKVQERSGRRNNRGFKHDGGGPRGCQSGSSQD